MITSTANARQNRNLETPTVEDLIPQALRANAENLIRFIKEYYDHLNSEGLPSCEISRITVEHDIDRASATYIDAIQREIARGVPNARAIDRVQLYKKIISFYQTRGTEESILVFFRIFFDEFVEVFYPRDFLLIPSSGNWESNQYLDRKGFLSDLYKLRDSNYWQEFSYEIRSSLSIGDWVDSYKKMVHPAGLNLFAALLIQLFRSNIWDEAIDYYAPDPDYDINWLSGLVPPWLRALSTNSEGFHTPKSQPGWLEGNERFLKFLSEAIVWSPSGQASDTNYVRVALVSFMVLATQNTNTRDSTIRQEYQAQMKFFDTGVAIRSYAESTIAEALEPHVVDVRITTPFLNFSSIRTSSTSIWSESSFDDSAPDNTGPDWDMSSIAPEAPLVGDYTNSSITT
jgi:hypothetical protein